MDEHLGKPVERGIGDAARRRGGSHERGIERVSVLRGTLNKTAHLMVRICPGIDYLIADRGVKRLKIGRRIAKRVGFVHDAADGYCFHQVSPDPDRRAFNARLPRNCNPKKILDISLTNMVSYFYHLNQQKRED